MKNKDYIHHLQALGFNEIEALIYAFLVENSPSTGYRISHAIGKQPPNTYKAIAALQDKGAIIVEVGEKKLCRAVPPKELLDNLELRFKHHHQNAKRTLEALTHPSIDNRIYHLKTVDQVIQRSKAMQKRAQGIVLCDLFPGPLALLADSLKETAARGIHVVCRVYKKEQIEGVKTIHRTEYDPALKNWPGQQISIVVDGEEHLLGLLAWDMKKVHEAVWSNSTFLSCIHHNNISAEILLMHYKSGQGKFSVSDAEKLNYISLLEFRPLGLKNLFKLYNSEPKN